MESADSTQPTTDPTQPKKPYVQQPPTSFLKRWVIVPTPAALVIAMMPVAVFIHAILDNPLLSIVILAAAFGFSYILDKLHGKKPHTDAADDDAEPAVTVIVNDGWTAQLASLSARRRRIRIQWLLKRTMRGQHLLFLVGAFTVLLVISFLPSR